MLLHERRDPSLYNNLEHRRCKKPPTGPDDGECPSDKRAKTTVATNVEMDVWNHAYSAQQRRQAECFDIPHETVCRSLEVIDVFDM